MRKLFSFNMVSLDGFFEGPNHDIDWHLADEEFNQFSIEQLKTVGALVFGRVTYELMTSYWPTPAATKDDPVIAEMMNRLPKVVFSRTLEKADWNNTRLVKERVADEINALKQQPGNDIALFGSANLMSILIQLNLIDEHRIMVSPVVLGSGTPLFKNLDHRATFKLLNTRAFKSGNVLLCYQP